MKKLHLIIVISFIVCTPVIVSAQDNIVAKKKQEEEEATKKAAEKKPVKPQPLPASGKTIPPGMDVTKMVKKEFEKSGQAPKDASQPVEKKAVQEKSAEVHTISTNPKSPTTKELAEKLPDVTPKPVANGGYSKAPPPQSYNETKLYPQNNQQGNKTAATANSYGETKLYPQEQYQNLPLKKSNEPDNNLSTKKATNVVNQYDVVEPLPAYSNTPNNANKNNTLAGYDKPNAPLGGSSGTLPNQNQYSELKLAPRYDVVPPENQYNAAPSKSAAEIKREQTANPISNEYGPVPSLPSENNKYTAAQPKSAAEIKKEQTANPISNEYGPAPSLPSENNKYTAAQPKSAAEIKQEQERVNQQEANAKSVYGPLPQDHNGSTNGASTQAVNPKSVYGPLPQGQNGNSNGALTKEKEMIEVRTYQSTGGLVKQNEMAETKASKTSEKTTLTKEAELKEAGEIRAEAERKTAEIKEAERVKAETERKAADVKEAERVKAETERKAVEIREAKERKVIEEREKTRGHR